MRTTPDENRAFDDFIVSRLNNMQGPVRFLLPLVTGWQPAPNRQLIEHDLHINDPAFARALAKAYLDLSRSLT